MKRKVVVLSIFLVLFTLSVAGPKGNHVLSFDSKGRIITSDVQDVLETVVSEINETRFTWFDSILVNTIGSRPYNSSNNTQAMQFIAEQMNATERVFATYQWFTYADTQIANVIGTLPAANPHNQSKIIVSAHFDTVAISPGADDNGAGTSLLLEVANVLSQFNFNCTIEFVAFNAEEVGLIGSYYYAQQASQAGEDILFVINIDMCIWDNPDAPPNERLWIIYDGTVPYEDGESFADLALEVSRVYTTAPIQKISNTNSMYGLPQNWRRSDHARFWDVGIPALWVFEFNGFQNPYLHTPADSMDVESYNFTLGAQAAQVVAAAVAKMATPLPPLYISNPLQQPEVVTSDQNVTVTANVISVEAEVSNVILSHSADGGTNWTNTTMVNTTGTTYQGEIPAFAEGTRVSYKIIAYDDADNSAVNDNTGQYYVYVVVPPNHDVAVINFTLPATEAYPTWENPMDIKATVKNVGTFTESFNVTVYCNNTTLQTQTVTSLTPNTQKTLAFTWDIPDIPKTWPYPAYTFKAYANLTGDNNPNDNELTAGIVTVKWPGDIDGDGEVKLPDLVIIAKSWYKTVGEADYDYRADFDMDGEVKLPDLVKLAKNWYKGPLD